MEFILGCNYWASNAGEVKPTLPNGWKGFVAKGFPVLKDGKTVMCDIEYRIDDDGKVTLDIKQV